MTATRPIRLCMRSIVGIGASHAMLGWTAITPAAATEAFVLDPAHSQPMFEVRHLGFSVQRGTFTKARGRVTIDRAIGAASIDVVIDASSVRTNDERLDEVVKGRDFLDVANHPTIDFKSSAVTFDGDRLVRVAGELTLLDGTHPVVLTVANFACGQHPFTKRPMCGAEATTTIKRSDWGMAYGIPKMVGDDVRITIPIEAYRE